MVYAMACSNEVNMTNCYKQAEQFFKRCHSIHFKVLLSYWMMAGYLGPVDSVEEAYQKGHDILSGLIYEEKMLKLSDDNGEMIEFVTQRDSEPAHCKHQGFCAMEDLGFDDLLRLDDIGHFLLVDGMLRKQKGSVYGDHISRHVSHFGNGVSYLAHFNPTPNSLKYFLENVKQISVLLLRAHKSLPLIDFRLPKFETLTVLEISGSSHLSTLPIETISDLTQLQCLNLSDLLIESLPDGFFSKLRELRWLILRGCSRLCSLPSTHNLPQLQLIDLSHCTTLREMDSSDIIKYERLQMLDLSYTALVSPPYLVTSNITHVFLKGSKIRYLTFLQTLDNLRVLDLSGSRWIEYIDNANYGVDVLDFSRSEISVLILRGCTSLKRLPRMKKLLNLEVLDASGCESLRYLPKDLGNLVKLKELNLSSCISLRKLWPGLFDRMPCLLKLDLSATKVKHLPSFSNLTSLCKLSLRGLELDSLETLASLSNLVELDLSRVKIISSQELKLDFLQSLESLQTLNLSRTFVAKLPDICKLVDLKELLLADCQHLNVVSDLKSLTNLEILDFSLQEEIDADAQRGLSLSAPSSLRKLLLRNRCSVQMLFSLTSLVRLEFLDVHGSDLTIPAEVDLNGMHLSGMRNLQEGHYHQTITNPVEIHTVSVRNRSYNQPSGLDDYKDAFIKLDTLISEVQQNFESVNDNCSNNNFKSRFGMLQTEWKYILENFDRLKSSPKSKSSEELLLELMDAATHLSAADFSVDSTNFKQLFRKVVKLKLMVLPKQVGKGNLETTGISRKKPSFMKSDDNKGGSADIVEELSTHKSQVLLSSYHSLNKIQKNCLLCFSVFPCDADSTGALKGLVIKKRMLMYWWVGEGFIDPHHEDNIAQADANSTNAPNPDGNANLHRYTIEEVGKRILEVLTEKEFIEPVMKKGRETGSCCMHHSVHSFVTAQAKEEGFFDFNRENGKLSLHFTRSRRACLLKPQHQSVQSPSSCMIWANCIGSRNKLECFKNVNTLFNVNETMIDIKQEWFSEMKYLSVLCLGSWRSEDAEHIEVLNHKFLEDLKQMKQLKLLSLQGLSTITKLPDSICKLTNLIILDLRECSYLEELPATIGSLTNLTHLDITDCRLLHKLPKGIRLLSKLQVLKGFVITYVGGILQEGEVCSLRDLQKLGNLRDLSLAVNAARFPDNKDLQVFKELRNLRKLKISWENGYGFEDKDTTTERAMTRSKWQKLKCWHHQSSENDGEETPTSKRLDNIEKLELWCFPCESAPDWLVPSELKKLKKLYIVGGKLRGLHGGANENGWSVTTLRLKYLRDLDIRWLELKRLFPNMKYLERHQCRKLTLFPCDEEGVWVDDESRRHESEKQHFEELAIFPYGEEGILD